MNNERLLIHLHIPKTAGMTLRAVMDRQYKRETIHTVTPQFAEQVEELRGLPERRRRGLKLLRGHMAFGLHQHLDKPADYFTVLRHPVERIISYYYFIRRQPKERNYEAVVGTNMSLADFAASGLPMTINQQTKYVSGCMGDLTNALEIAERNLNTHFIAVGIAERFDETLLLLKRLLGWNHVFYHRQNATKNRPARTEVPGPVIKLIERTNALDMQLYETALRKFDVMLDDLGVLAEEVRDFRRKNRLYDSAGACLDRVRSAVPPRVKRIIRRIVPGT